MESNIVDRLIGMTPLQVCKEGLATLANQLIDERVIHVSGFKIINGPSKISPPLKISICTRNEALAQFLSLEK